MGPPTVRVLLIEDDPDDALLIEEMLSASCTTRVEVVHVKLLALGLRRLSQEPFDVVLVDMSLPDSWGVETLQRARVVAGQVPVILMTGADLPEVAEEAEKAGAAAYLFKSQVDERGLWETIRRAMNPC